MVKMAKTLRNLHFFDTFRRVLTGAAWPLNGCVWLTSPKLSRRWALGESRPKNTPGLSGEQTNGPVPRLTC